MNLQNFLATSAIALGLSACAAQVPAPAAQPVAAAAAAGPQCWNGDAGQFQPVGTQASISGVSVVCEKTSDGKSAQWMGKKH